MKIIRDITIILGPPGPAGDKRKFEEWSKNSGKPKEDIWLDYAQAVLARFANRESPEAPSTLDLLVSDILEVAVRVNDPSVTWWCLGGVRYPALVLVISRITGPNGETLSIDGAATPLRRFLGAFFGLELKAEWIRTFETFPLEKEVHRE